MTGLIRDLTAASSFEATDIFEITKDPSGTPLSRKATGTQLLDFVTATAKGVVTSTSAPTVNDDSGDGYAAGWLWAKTDTRGVYVCCDASSGAAVWRHVGGMWQQLAQNTTTSGATSDFTSISQIYTDLMLVFDGVSHNDGSSRNFTLAVDSDNGVSFGTAVNLLAGNVDASTPQYGTIMLPMYSTTFRKTGYAAVGSLDAASNARALVWTETAAINALRFAPAAGSFDAGTITLLGR